MALTIEPVSLDDPVAAQPVAASVLERDSRAAELGFSQVRLETGGCMPEALGLYVSAGFEPIPWGQYAGDARSRCYGLVL